MWRMMALFAAVLLVLVLSANITGQSNETKEVTFSKDVAPVVYANCVYCHRPGEIGPFSLLTYKDARPWARAIKQAVLTRQMPPWLADPHYGDFQGSRRLSDRDVQTIAAWVDSGAKEGNPADVPAPPTFAEGWQIGTPDLILTMKQPYTIPAAGTIAWLTLPAEDYTFPEDTWLQAIEVRPGNRAVVHHATVGVTGPGDNGSEITVGNMHLYSPGLEAMIWREGYGKLIRKGSRVQFGMHYNAIGKEQTDQTKVGFVFAKKPVHTEVRTTIVSNNTMLVPPMARSHEVIAAFQIPFNARIHALRPHMHIRAKTGSATVVYPDGKRNVLLHIPNWDDSWQNYYIASEPVGVPKGAFLEYVANYDNSPANPLNPDPAKPVAWGQQVWEEMHSVYMTWTEINDKNKNDTAPIQIPVSKAFTTGVLALKK